MWTVRPANEEQKVADAPHRQCAPRRPAPRQDDHEHERSKKHRSPRPAPGHPTDDLEVQRRQARQHVSDPAVLIEGTGQPVSVPVGYAEPVGAGQELPARVETPEGADGGDAHEDRVEVPEADVRRRHIDPGEEVDAEARGLADRLDHIHRVGQRSQHGQPDAKEHNAQEAVLGRVQPYLAGGHEQQAEQSEGDQRRVVERLERQQRDESEQENACELRTGLMNPLRDGREGADHLRPIEEQRLVACDSPVDVEG